MDLDKVEVHNTQKKERGQYQLIFSHLDQTSLVNKGFIIWPKDYTKEFRFCGKKGAIPSGEGRSILPARVANHNAGFALSCPLQEPAKK